MRRLLIVVVVGSLALLSCGDDDVATSTTSSTGLPTVPPQGSPEQDRLDAARARWDASGIEDYEWTYERSCFCPRFTVTVQVEGGVAVSHQVEPQEGGFPESDEDPQILTMTDLFDEVQEAIDTADALTVDYEEQSGSVTSIDVDPIKNAIDDEYGYVVRDVSLVESSPG